MKSDRWRVVVPDNVIPDSDRVVVRVKLDSSGMNLIFTADEAIELADALKEAGSLAKKGQAT